MGINGINGVIRPATAALFCPRALRAVVTLGLAMNLVAVAVVATVLIITAVVMVIVTVLVVSGVGNPFGFFGVGVFVCCLYQFTDGCGPLVVQLAPKLLVLEPFGESDDGLGVSDVGNEISCLREALDEVT